MFSSETGQRSVFLDAISARLRVTRASAGNARFAEDFDFHVESAQRNHSYGGLRVSSSAVDINRMATVLSGIRNRAPDVDLRACCDAGTSNALVYQTKAVVGPDFGEFFSF